MTGHKARPSFDDRKEKIITFLQKQANKHVYWFTATEIAKGTKQSYETAWEVLKSMVSDGFLNVRDGDTENQKILIALKTSLRDTTWWEMKKSRKGDEP